MKGGKQPEDLFSHFDFNFRLQSSCWREGAVSGLSACGSTSEPLLRAYICRHMVIYVYVEIYLYMYLWPARLSLLASHIQIVVLILKHHFPLLTMGKVFTQVNETEHRLVKMMAKEGCILFWSQLCV